MSVYYLDTAKADIRMSQVVIGIGVTELIDTVGHNVIVKMYRISSRSDEARPCQRGKSGQAVRKAVWLRTRARTGADIFFDRSIHRGETETLHILSAERV